MIRHVQSTSFPFLVFKQKWNNIYIRETISEFCLFVYDLGDEWRNSRNDWIRFDDVFSFKSWKFEKIDQWQYLRWARLNQNLVIPPYMKYYLWPSWTFDTNFWVFQWYFRSLLDFLFSFKFWIDYGQRFVGMTLE